MLIPPLTSHQSEAHSWLSHEMVQPPSKPTDPLERKTPPPSNFAELIDWLAEDLGVDSLKSLCSQTSRLSKQFSGVLSI